MFTWLTKYIYIYILLVNIVVYEILPSEYR